MADAVHFRRTIDRKAAFGGTTVINFKSVVAVSAAGAVFLASAAQAATLTPQGDVLVNRGDGFKAAAASGQVATGDVVMVRAGGAASVVFSDGCRVSVDVGSSYTVGASSPCAAAANQPSAAATTTAAAGGLGLGTTGILVGAGVVAVGAGVAIAAAKKKSPASP